MLLQDELEVKILHKMAAILIITSNPFQAILEKIVIRISSGLSARMKE